MSINLIPKEERKKINKSFYYKIAILFFFVLGFAATVFFVSILPSYFLSFTKVTLINSKLENQKAEPMPELNQETSLIIKDLDNKLGVIEQTQKDKFVFSERVIRAILAKKIPEIKLTEIYYENDPLKGPKVTLSGTAPSREILLYFRQALEGDIAFKQVNLPISNFIKGSNIQFTLTLIPS